MSFTLEKKETQAYLYRAKGSTLLAGEEDLKIVYNKYKTNCPLPKSESQLRFNLIFCHGTGFNKSIWHYHIKRLYQLSQSLQVPWFLDSVLSIDALGHGDSSLANYGKLGPVFTWDDGARDVIQVMQHEIKTTGDFKNNLESRNVLIGHSMGGFVALYAAFLGQTLFDSVIPIEAVIYGKPEGFELFKKIFGKVQQLMIDTFDSEEDARFFFEHFNFTKKFNKEVLNDYIGDEIIKVKDKESGNDIYKIKCLKPHQMAGYCGAFVSIYKGMSALPLIKVPVLHVIGEKAKWNPPESKDWIRNAIDPKYFAGGVDVKDGEHLLVGEMPDAIVDVIKDFLNKRNSDFKSEVAEMPETKLKGDKKAIFDQEYEALLNFDLEKMYGFELFTRYDLIGQVKL